MNQFRQRLLHARLWLTLLAVGLPLLEASASEIQFTNGQIIFVGTNGSVALSADNGSIRSVTVNGLTNSIVASGEFGLWSITDERGGRISASSFTTNSSSNLFSWYLPRGSGNLLLNYSNAAVSVSISVSGRGDGIDLAGEVKSLQETALEFDLPARLRFSPSNLSRLIAPLHSSDGGGAEFEPSFFEIQAQTDPTGWTNSLVGEAGYISLYGNSLTFISDSAPPAPVNFTSAGITWLGTNVASNWNGTAAIVNRPPAPGQADLVLLTSTNGSYFSASHLGGKGYLFRLGGEVDDASTNLAQDLVIAAIEHLAQTTHAATRTNVALLNLENGPATGGWAAVPVTYWSNRLALSTALAQSGVQIVQISNIPAILAALASNTFLVVLNPYGEWTPSLTTSGINGSLTAIGAYVRGGGNWFETGGNSFYYALLPTLYYNYSVPYPPAFADFLQIESLFGSASLYGVQPDSAPPWAGSNNPAALFVPGRLAWGGDVSGGYCERAFGTYVAPGQTWDAPTVRLTTGHSAPDALAAYCQANNYHRALADKISPAALNQFTNSLLIYYNGSCADKLASLPLLPTPALVHFADYLMGGFDHEYPDHLPPNAAFGTPSEFTNFLAHAHQRGLLIMPYTNPTWWPNDPPGPTFVADGDAPLLRNLDGTLSYEIYGANYGYTVCHWHPDVEAANQKTVDQFTTNYPVDFLFEDQCGARTWQYDLNPASPSPYAYADGIASRVAEDSATLPLSTENGWDRLVNHESQFCGMAWAIVPTENPPAWRTFLRDRFVTSTWNIYPVAQYIAHDKVSFILHDLGQFVTDDEVLSWNLGLGYGLSYYVNAPDLSQPSTLQWLLWLDRIQKSICANYVGQSITSFSHAWGATDNGVIQSSYGQVNILANLSPQPLATNGLTLAPFGFYATAPGTIVGHLITPSATNGVAYVLETNGANVQFWVYTTGEQSASIPLPPGLNGPANLQLDGHSNNPVTVPDGALAVLLGMTPTQDRVQPPPAVAGLAPANWPGPKPAIGALDFPGFPSAWTTVTPDQWLQAFRQSSLSTQFNLPIVAITNLSQLTLTLQGGPTNYLAIINPNGENFPESAAGEWPATLALIQNYVNNGGSWWETAGYSFYNANWLQSGSWQSDSVGPDGMDYFGLPVGGGVNNQPAEPLNVTPLGQTIFGPTLSAQLQGMTTIVNRGLLPVSQGDPGHIALLSGAQQDFLGAYRLGGWGYLWRLGGFFPNPTVSTNAVIAVMTWLYTNAPQPALASSVNYLWHGNLTFLPRPTLQAALLADAVTFQINNCPPGADNHLQRSPTLANPDWQTILTFTTPATNFTDTISSTPTAFYRVLSIPTP